MGAEVAAIDHTPHSTVIVCRCGCRFLAGTRAGAWAAHYEHVQAAHPTRAALAAATAGTRRANGSR